MKLIDFHREAHAELDEVMAYYDYVEMSDRIWITAVAHAKRRLDYGKRRIPDEVNKANTRLTIKGALARGSARPI